MPRFSNALLLLAVVLLVGPAAEADAPQELDVLFVKACLAKRDTADLQHCVRRLAKLVALYEKDRQSETSFLAACAAAGDIDELRACIAPLATRPRSNAADEPDATLRAIGEPK